MILAWDLLFLSLVLLTPAENVAQKDQENASQVIFSATKQYTMLNL